MPPFFSPTIPLRIHFSSLYVRLYILTPTLTPIYFFTLCSSPLTRLLALQLHLHLHLPHLLTSTACVLFYFLFWLVEK